MLDSLSATHVRLLIASRQPIFLDGLEALLHRVHDFSVPARCEDDDAIAEKIRELAPDIAVIDVDTPDGDPLHVVRGLAERAAAVKVVLVAARPDDHTLIDAVRLGVRGVVFKSMASPSITDCIRKVHAGGYSLDKPTTTAALSRLVRREAAERRLARAGLTARELEITRLAGVGVPNVAIGTRLRISPGTVKIHLHQIYRKLGLAGRTALMGYAREHDIVQR